MCNLKADELKFWVLVEDLLSPPTTKNGARAGRYQANRYGAFVTNVKLGVVALENGEMRAHLWSIKGPRHLQLRALERDVETGKMRPAIGGAKPTTRPGDHNPDYLILEFAWQREGAYTKELPQVSSFVDWFVSARARF